MASSEQQQQKGTTTAALYAQIHTQKLIIKIPISRFPFPYFRKFSLIFRFCCFYCKIRYSVALIILVQRENVGEVTSNQWWWWKSKHSTDRQRKHLLYIITVSLSLPLYLSKKKELPSCGSRFFLLYVQMMLNNMCLSWLKVHHYSFCQVTNFEWEWKKEAFYVNSI